MPLIEIGAAAIQPTVELARKGGDVRPLGDSSQIVEGQIEEITAQGIALSNTPPMIGIMMRSPITPFPSFPPVPRSGRSSL